MSSQQMKRVRASGALDPNRQSCGSGVAPPPNPAAAVTAAEPLCARGSTNANP